jgi:hypothetical protein
LLIWKLSVQSGAPERWPFGFSSQQGPPIAATRRLAAVRTRLRVGVSNEDARCGDGPPALE